MSSSHKKLFLWILFVSKSDKTYREGQEYKTALLFFFIFLVTINKYNKPVNVVQVYTRMSANLSSNRLVLWLFTLSDNDLRTGISDCSLYSPYSGAGEVLVWQGLSLPAVLSSDGWVQRCQKAFTLLSQFSVVSVEHLLVPFGEGSVFKKKSCCFVFQSGGGEWRKTCKHYSSFRSQGWLSSIVSIIHYLSISFSDWLSAAAFAQSSQLERFTSK